VLEPRNVKKSRGATASRGAEGQPSAEGQPTAGQPRSVKAPRSPKEVLNAKDARNAKAHPAGQSRGAKERARESPSGRVPRGAVGLVAALPHSTLRELRRAVDPLAAYPLAFPLAVIPVWPAHLRPACPERTCPRPACRPLAVPPAVCPGLAVPQAVYPAVHRLACPRSAVSLAGTANRGLPVVVQAVAAVARQVRWAAQAVLTWDRAGAARATRLACRGTAARSWRAGFGRSGRPQWQVARGRPEAR
jgi:hypothetical protein